MRVLSLLSLCSLCSLWLVTIFSLRFNASWITLRRSPSGSLTMALVSLNTIVARVVELYAVHFVSLSVFGAPVRAKAIQASLILSASAAGRGPPPVNRFDSSVLSKAIEISRACGDFSRPPCTGVSQAGRSLVPRRL